MKGGEPVALSKERTAPVKKIKDQGAFPALNVGREGVSSLGENGWRGEVFGRCGREEL